MAAWVFRARAAPGNAETRAAVSGTDYVLSRTPAAVKTYITACIRNSSKISPVFS